MSCSFDDAAKLKSAIAGDRDALAQLLVDHGGRLTRRLATRLQHNPFIDFSVEDVLQEVFLDVDRGIATFDADAATQFSTWLDKVADNRLAKMIRDRSRVKRGGGRKRVGLVSKSLQSSVSLLLQHLAANDSSGTASKHVARKEVIQAVRDGLAALPAEHRAAVEQYYLDECTLDSTAHAMKKTAGAVRGLLHRAKHAMRDALGHSSRWFGRR